MRLGILRRLLLGSALLLGCSEGGETGLHEPVIDPEVEAFCDEVAGSYCGLIFSCLGAEYAWQSGYGGNVIECRHHQQQMGSFPACDPWGGCTLDAERVAECRETVAATGCEAFTTYPALPEVCHRVCAP